MITSFLLHAKPEIERLNIVLNKALSDGRLGEAQEAAKRIAEITAWGAVIEDIQTKVQSFGQPAAKAVPKAAPNSATETLVARAPVKVSLPAPAPAAPVQPVGELEAPAPPPEEVSFSAPILRSPGRPKVLAPEPTEEDKLKLRRKQLESRVKVFLDSSRDLMGEETLSPVMVARAKSLIIESRAIEAEAMEIKSHLRGTVREETLMIGQWWDRVSENPEFFGLNQGRTHSPEVWTEVAEAYRLLADAEEAVTWLESEPGITEIQRNGVMEMSACAEALLLRVFDDRGMNVWDAQQKDLHVRLEKFEPPSFVTRWWKRTDPPNIDELKKRARLLAEEVSSLKKAKERSERSSSALADLKEYMAVAVGSQFDEDILREKICTAMAAGVAPSHRELRNLLAGYRFVLEGSTDRDVQKLDQYLAKDALELIAKRRQIVEPPMEEEDAELAAKITALWPLTQGKTVMFVGGSKGQGWRKDEYVKLLGLKEMMWPDAEEGTKVTDLAGKVSKADIVCLLIRFSRHSYKGVLDEAKGQGKATVTLPRGYGVNTVVHEMWSQLLNNGQAGN